MQPIKFTGIDRAKYQAIRARVRAQAVTTQIDGDTGTATGNTPLGQVTLSWIYDEPSLTLTVQCMKKPLLVSETMFAAKIHGLMETL